MFNKKIFLVLAMITLVTIGTYTRSEGSEEETVTGTVVGYDVGLELTKGSCRQTIIVRTKKPDKVKQESEYIIVRYETLCMKLLPERILKKGPQWKFSLTRDVDCDQELGELLYIKQLNPTGDVYRYPRLKFAPGAERERIPTDTKLPCYVLRPGGFEPS